MDVKTVAGKRVSAPSADAAEIATGSASAAEELVRKLLAQATGQGTASSHGAVESGDVVFNAEVDGFRCTLVRRGPERSAAFVLSPREREIARMIAKGHPNKVIAAVLEISPWTVSTHLRRMFGKMGVSSRTAMVTRLLEAGLLE